jgi:hypothetical protein
VPLVSLAPPMSSELSQLLASNDASNATV